MRKLAQNETQVQPEVEQVEIDDEIYQSGTEEGPKLSDEPLYDEKQTPKLKDQEDIASHILNLFWRIAFHSPLLSLL